MEKFILIHYRISESIFPPVFGRRLQAQVVRKGQRVNMDVEITGTPEPEVTWLKDNRPLNEIMTSQYKLKKQGICHTLVIEGGSNYKCNRVNTNIFNFSFHFSQYSGLWKIHGKSCQFGW